MMAYHINLYLTYLRLTAKSWWQYQADFAISMVSLALHDGSSLLFLGVIFASIRQLEGWSLHEILLIWALEVVIRNVARFFFDVPHRIHMYVQSGDLDRLLVRPSSLLLQIAGERGMSLEAVGQILVGTAALLAVLPGLHLPWWSIFYLPLTIISGVFIMCGMHLLVSCLNFCFTNALAALSTVTWMYRFGQYPVTIFALPLRLLLTWVLPYAMMGFYPAAFLLRGDEYRFYGLLAPLVGFFLFGLSLLVWRVSLRRYQSTGS
jgi:ABC-2 type transport system permease protein